MSLEAAQLRRALTWLCPVLTVEDLRRLVWLARRLAAARGVPLAFTAERSLRLFEAEAKARQREHGGTAPGRENTGGKNATSEFGKARDQAAAAVGVSPRYVSDAKPPRSPLQAPPEPRP